MDRHRMMRAMGTRTTLAATALWVLASAQAAQAEPVAALDAAPSLTERDGSMRAEVGLRLAVTHAPSKAGDHAVAIGERVQKQLPRVRGCYQQAVSQDATLQGVLAARLQNVAQGGRKVRLLANGTHDQGFARCVLQSLARTRLAGLPRGAAVRVDVQVSAPAAAAKREMARRAAAAQAVTVQKETDGRVRSEGATQGGEVQFSLQSKAHDRDALVALHHDVSERLAGLLDCRRRASRRGVAPRGTLVFDVQTERAGVQRVHTVKNPFRNPKASACVDAWLRRGEGESLSKGRVRLSLSYGP